MICAPQPHGQGKTGRFWIYTSKGDGQFAGCTIYRFTKGRHGVGPQDFLREFTGYLQADAYAGFDGIFADSRPDGKLVIEVACWAHARRYFVEAASSSPQALAHEMVALIGKLYSIEAQARERNLDASQIKQLRQKYVEPILQQIYNWLLQYKEYALPKSNLAQAINYALNNWQALTNYVQEGYLEIDNNRSERGIRPLAVGRKNYLFVGNNMGGRTAAIMYSLIETCKQHEINPQVYLQDVLMRVSSHPNSKIDELLPYNWQPPDGIASRVTIATAA